MYFLYITSEVNSTMRSKFTFVATYITFIILCYKGRKDTIGPGGSQFTCYNLSVSLCTSTGKAKMKNQVGILLCGSLEF